MLALAMIPSHRFDFAWAGARAQVPVRAEKKLDLEASAVAVFCTANDAGAGLNPSATR